MKRTIALSTFVLASILSIGSPAFAESLGAPNSVDVSKWQKQETAPICHVSGITTFTQEFTYQKLPLVRRIVRLIAGDAVIQESHFMIFAGETHYAAFFVKSGNTWKQYPSDEQDEANAEADRVLKIMVKNSKTKQSCN